MCRRNRSLRQRLDHTYLHLVNQILSSPENSSSMMVIILLQLPMG